MSACRILALRYALQTTKWLHRQFRWIIPFGRACLIPNLRFVGLMLIVLAFAEVILQLYL
jgi:hypothetical protein